MRKFVTCLIAGTMFFGAPVLAFAQEAVTVDGVAGTRVVIGPPANDLARMIRTDLSTAYYGANPSSPAYAEAQKLYYFYGARHFAPLWLDTASSGSPSFSPAAEKIIDVFKASTAEGFRPSDYLTKDIDVTAAGTDPQKLAALETAFSASAVR